MKLDNKTKAAVEHYAFSVVVAGVAIWQTGERDLSKIAYAAVVAVLGPVIKSAYDKAKAKAKAKK